MCEPQHNRPSVRFSPEKQDLSRRIGSTRLVHTLGAFLVIGLPAFAYAGVCDLTWDGDKLAESARTRSISSGMRLLDKEKNVKAEVTSAQILAFHEAKEAIAREVGRTPTFVICDNAAPNAFASKGSNGDVVGVTVGMMKLANGDRDMAAAVIGHEFAHHIKDHGAAGQSREVVLGLLGIIVGVALDQKIQSRGGVTGLGQDIGRIGSTLVARKFDRDQEREADELGFNYMVATGFNPNGAVRLAERMKQLGLSSAGLFFDSHPGWDERGDRYRGFISTNPVAQQVIARTGTATQLTSIVTPTAQTATVTLAPTYETTDAQKSFNEGLTAFRRNDFAAGIRDIRSAAAAGYAPAQSVAGWIFMTGRGGIEKNELEAVRLFRAAAAQNDPQGINNLGAMYARGGIGIEKDAAEAIRLYRQAADLGYAQSMKNLGDAYNAGLLGLPKDQGEALSYYRRASELGLVDATAMVGAYHYEGLGGLSKDEAEGVKLVRIAAEKGSALGEHLLGFASLRGGSVLVKDEAEAAKHLKIAADKGLAASQNLLGSLYMNGQGVPKNEVEAVRLYRLAVAQGFAVAQSNLGHAYLNGRGGLFKDEVEAARLFKMSADQGNGNGLFNLALMYENGRGGLARDVDLAVSLYQKAAALGIQPAKAKLQALGRG